MFLSPTTINILLLTTPHHTYPFFFSLSTPTYSFFSPLSSFHCFLVACFCIYISCYSPCISIKKKKRRSTCMRSEVYKNLLFSNGNNNKLLITYPSFCKIAFLSCEPRAVSISSNNVQISLSSETKLKSF